MPFPRLVLLICHGCLYVLGWEKELLNMAMKLRVSFNRARLPLHTFKGEIVVVSREVVVTTTATTKAKAAELGVEAALRVAAAERETSRSSRRVVLVVVTTTWADHQANIRRNLTARLKSDLRGRTEPTLS